MVVINIVVQKASVFVPTDHSHPNLIFARQVEAYLSGAPLLALLQMLSYNESDARKIFTAELKSVAQ
jgi:hypothetical protein